MIIMKAMGPKWIANDDLQLKQVQQNAEWYHLPTLVLKIARHGSGKHTQALWPPVSHFCHFTEINRTWAASVRSRRWTTAVSHYCSCHERTTHGRREGFPPKRQGGSSHTAFPRYEVPTPQVVGGRVTAGYKPVMRITAPGLLGALEPVICEGSGGRAVMATCDPPASPVLGWRLLLAFSIRDKAGFVLPNAALSRVVAAHTFNCSDCVYVQPNQPCDSLNVCFPLS